MYIYDTRHEHQLLPSCTPGSMAVALIIFPSTRGLQLSIV